MMSTSHTNYQLTNQPHDEHKYLSIEYLTILR